MKLKKRKKNKSASFRNQVGAFSDLLPNVTNAMS